MGRLWRQAGYRVNVQWLVSGSVKDYNSKKRSRKRKREVGSGVARPYRRDKGMDRLERKGAHGK